MHGCWPSTSALVIFAVLTFVAPFWDLPTVRRLKADPNSARRIRFYATTLLVLWGLALACWLWRSAVILTAWSASGGLDLLFRWRWAEWALTAVTVGFFGLALAPGLHCLLQPSRVPAYTRAYGALAFFLPHTQPERVVFAFLSLSAGFCEEWIFRGFVLQTLHGAMCFSWIASLLVSSLLFGLNHIYQGARAILMTALLGLALGLAAIASGGLLLPMILHAVLDLQLILVFRPELVRKR